MQNFEDAETPYEGGMRGDQRERPLALSFSALSVIVRQFQFS